MKLTPTALAGVHVLTSTVISDARGAFSRLYCEQEMREAVGQRRIVQINHSITRKVGAVRGMHFQVAPYAELKVVRCLQGRVFDVAVDLRRNSPTFLKWVSQELAPETNSALIIPEGCAHGFQVLEAESHLLYLHTNFYSPANEGGVRFDDPRLAIEWPRAPTDLSGRDLGHRLLTSDFEGLEV